MTSKKTIMLVYGGGGEEHEISIISASYLQELLQKHSPYQLIPVEMTKEGYWQSQAHGRCFLGHDRQLICQNGESIEIDLAIPCLHGYPGETGDVQSVFALYNLPYIGSDSESSKICFNKVTTKLYLQAWDIPVAPSIFLSHPDSTSIEKAMAFHKQHHKTIIKASSQGSSVGCYMIEDIKDLEKSIRMAFDLSPYVLIEKVIQGREIEVAVYEYKDKLEISYPGEILAHNQFYSYEEKYSKKSQTLCLARANEISDKTIESINKYAKMAFENLRLKDLSRIDFFLSQNNDVYINEINTMPGLTPISLFPKMVEENGHSFSDYLIDRIDHLL